VFGGGGVAAWLRFRAREKGRTHDWSAQPWLLLRGRMEGPLTRAPGGSQARRRSTCLRGSPRWTVLALDLPEARRIGIALPGRRFGGRTRSHVSKAGGWTAWCAAEKKAKAPLHDELTHAESRKLSGRVLWCEADRFCGDRRPCITRMGGRFGERGSLQGGCSGDFLVGTHGLQSGGGQGAVKPGKASAFLPVVTVWVKCYPR